MGLSPENSVAVQAALEEHTLACLDLSGAAAERRRVEMAWHAISDERITSLDLERAEKTIHAAYRRLRRAKEALATAREES